MDFIPFSLRIAKEHVSRPWEGGQEEGCAYAVLEIRSHLHSTVSYTSVSEWYEAGSVSPLQPPQPPLSVGPHTAAPSQPRDARASGTVVEAEREGKYCQMQGRFHLRLGLLRTNQISVPKSRKVKGYRQPLDLGRDTVSQIWYKTSSQRAT